MAGEVEGHDTASRSNRPTGLDVLPDLGAGGVAVYEKECWVVIFPGCVGYADEAVWGVKREATACHIWIGSRGMMVDGIVVSVSAE